jgi:predicted Rossmann-fold nucleotide-binding protein
MEAAAKLAKAFADHSINLVYGGGGGGMMGKIARSCLALGLEVDGVIPTYVASLCHRI